MQGNLFKTLKINNQFLFSDYYLDKILPEQEWFKSVDGIEQAFKKIKDLYTDKKNTLSSLAETPLEDEFIRPVLKILDHMYVPGTSLRTMQGVKHPDYAFFSSESEKEEALKHPREKDFWLKAIGVGDAKAWNINLDKKIKGPGDPFDNSIPSAQIDTYLKWSEKKWAILTNGRYWRLFNRENSFKLGIFYEIDLPMLVEQGNIDDFKYFYLFFGQKGFIPEHAKPSFLDRVFQGSIEYAKEVGDRLKDNVYEALRLLCEGFLKYSTNNILASDLESIHENALVYLYRLLFILYAESLELLPINSNETYRDTFSLKSLKEDIAKYRDGGKTFSFESTKYWNALYKLFSNINIGNPLLEIPAYNGGLFDANNYPFLDKRTPNEDETLIKVSDGYLAEVVDLLARTEMEEEERKAFVDYRSLSIHHLGSIYEGLLEYHVNHADNEIMIVRDNGVERHIKLGEKLTKDQRDTGKRVKRGEIYLETNKGERKATGSYYTPEHIVDYIVDKTLTHLCQEIDDKIKVNIEKLEDKIDDSQGAEREKYEKELEKLKTSFDDEVLKLKVLDPAMGSGHFLVRATEHLAEEIATNPNTYEEYAPENEAAIDYWKRRVVENCIYGVDLNPLAVELSKLSLWLKTVSKGKPLSFLDHHLRCGNSLIGVGLKSLKFLPELNIDSKASYSLSEQEQVLLFDEGRFSKDASLIVAKYKEIEDLPSNTVQQVKQKDRILTTEINTYREKYINQANLWASAFFGNQMTHNIYRNLMLERNGFESQLTREQAKPFFDKAESLAKEKQFFHWELEFPEVFFDEIGNRKENAGFDVVIGNPPYDVISEKEQGREVKNEKDFFKINSLYEHAMGSKLNFYRLFTVSSLNLLRESGMHGFIVPMALLGDKQAKPLRKYLLRKNNLRFVEAFPQKDDPQNRVFFDAKLSTCVYIVKKSSPTSFKLRVHPGKYMLDTSPIIKIKNQQIELLDPENLSIPSYPGITANDFELAIKLIRECHGARLGNWPLLNKVK